MPDNNGFGSRVHHLGDCDPSLLGSNDMDDLSDGVQLGDELDNTLGSSPSL